MMKFYRGKVLNVALLLGAMALVGGCNLISKPATVNTIPVGTISSSNIADSIVNLITSVRRADDGTLSVKNVSNELTVQRIESMVVANLKTKGYAVQSILPSDLRQKGDVKEMVATGTLITIDLFSLEGTTQYQLKVTLGDDVFYRLLTKSSGQLRAISSWIRLQN